MSQPSAAEPRPGRRWQDHIRLADPHPVPAGQPVDVSVCIVNWNCCRLLRDCLESLHDRPQGVRLETIVVDNASKDGAADMVAALFPEVVLRRNAANLGFSRANNQGSALARGRYLFFLNNDTVVPGGTLRRLFDFAEAHPEVGMLGPLLRDGQGNVQVSYRRRLTLAALVHRINLLRWTGLLSRAHRRYRREDFDPKTTRAVEVLMGAALFVRRDVFEECGRWDEGFVFGGEDLELSVRVGRRYPLVFFPRVEITHYGRVSSRQNHGYLTAHMAAGHIRYLRKAGYSRLAVGAYKLALTLDVPVQLVRKGVEYLVRRLRGRRAKAQKSLLQFRGLRHLLFRNLGTLWKQ
jgi:GT2 family glycosyltransferase